MGGGGGGDPPRSADEAEVAAAVAMLMAATWACHLATLRNFKVVSKCVCVKENYSKATKGLSQGLSFFSADHAMTILQGLLLWL